MNFIIRPALKDDMCDVLSLIKELAVFENEPDAVEISVEDLINHGFKSDPMFLCHVAIYGDKIVGMSLGYRRYSTWKGPTMHLEDLIVSRNYRRKGIATALKIKAIEKLIEKGITEIRTDNEENNPMYKINLSLGFESVPFSLEYMKEI